MAKYIDKLQFHNYLKEYKECNDILEDFIPVDDEEIKELEHKRDKAYENIGKCFLLIAKNYLNKPFYINYSSDWKDDMISEAVYDMVRYIDNYKVDEMEERYVQYGKVPDPFSYFSQYVYNGIMRFLGEKKKDKDVLVRLPFIENIDKRDISYE